MDLAPTLNAFWDFLGRIVPPDAMARLPADGEVALWAVTQKPEVHMLLGTAFYARHGASWTDIMPHPNLLVLLDSRWARKQKPVLYAVARSPVARGGLRYSFVDPMGNIYELPVNDDATRLQAFVVLAAEMPAKAGLWRDVAR